MDKTRKTELRREERRFIEEWTQRYIDNLDELFLNGKVDQFTYNKSIHDILAEAEAAYLDIKI